MPFDCVLEDKSFPTLVESDERRCIDTISQAVADLDMKIVWDETTGTIKIGKATFNKYTNYKSAGSFAEILLRAHGIDNFSRHPKWFNKAGCALVKGSMKQTYQFFKALQYKAFVVPNKHLIGKISFTRGRINVRALEKIRANKEVLQQVYDDKLYHLLPVVAATGSSPQVLKKEFGPAWKAISNNKLHRNKVLVNAMLGAAWDNYTEDFPQRVCAASKLPTTVLQEFNQYSMTICQHIAQHYRGKWKAKYVSGVSPNWGAISYEVNDTQHMAETLDEKFDPLWTPRKMKEKHDEFARRVNALRYSSEPIPWLENILPRFEHEGCVATLLNNRAAIAQEGNEMGHCVGSYAESVASKSYLVYSVMSPSGERSTLGIRVKTPVVISDAHGNQVTTNGYMLNQHYRRFNKPLEEDAEKEMGMRIVNKLNSGEKE